MTEKEYLGTVQECRVNADYAAVRFDSRVNLHMVHYLTLLLLLTAVVAAIVLVKKN